MKILIRALWLLPLAFTACTRTPAPTASMQAVAPSLRVEPMTLPMAAAAAQPDLIVDEQGRLLLSWIEPQDDAHALKFASFADDRWSAPQTIATGGDWFVNWADTPHVAITPDGALWAHWLQKSAQATYAYDVMLVRSADDGRSWSKPLPVNADGKAAEHGFVSLWPAARDALGIAWLDGRETVADAHAAHDNHGAAGTGAMTLRAAMFDAQLQRRDDTRIDAMTCDCCQTDVALTARGPLLVYRDRTSEEIRDIAVTRQQQGGVWTTAHTVHDDRWNMPACPVNGPAVAAQGNDVLVGWYTAAGNTPTLKLARSADAGDTFAAPVVVDSGEAVQGRIDVALERDAAWVLWLRETPDGQSLQLARYARDLMQAPQRIEVAKLQGRGRATGFAQLVLRNGAPHVVWTDIVAGKPELHAAVITR